MKSTVENFGKYALLERLAAGGMAEVYLAKSSGAGGIAKFVAIKRILPQYSDNTEFMEMFKEEAKIAVNLNHGNVVSIFDFGVEKKQLYLVMEYVEGQNLRQVLNHLKKENKTFSIDQITYIIKEVAAGLDHAHRCLDGTTGRPLNITHRDMSPQNVMISFEGEVKVVDFGIAKAESQTEQTRAGTIKGKFGYMSPEQAEGFPVDLRTDIFSLGIVFWELLANDRLFASNSEAGTLRKIRECQIPSLRKINPRIPEELERICNKALAKDKNMRYQTSASFHRDLNRFLNTQYPEFSAHDFSLFMKSAFSEMFLANRKKLVDYAKLPSPVQRDHGTSDQSNSAGTQTGTATSTETGLDANSQLPPDLPPPDLPEAFRSLGGIQTSNLNLKELQTKRDPVSKSPFLSPTKDNTASTPNLSTASVVLSGSNPNKTSTSAARSGNYQQPYYSTAPQSSSSFPAWIIPLFALAIGSGWYWSQYPAKGAHHPAIAKFFSSPVSTKLPANVPEGSDGRLLNNRGSLDMASKTYYSVAIDSNPSGARVFVNGEDTGSVTPLRHRIEANSDARISIRKDGYHMFERTEKVTQEGTTITANLEKLPEYAYLSIDLVNGGDNPVITINGQRIEGKAPIRMYAVPSNTTLEIEAVNPFSQLRAKQTIKLDPSQKKQIQLIMSRQASH